MKSLALVKIANRRLAFPHHHIHAIERCSSKDSRIRISGIDWQLKNLDGDFHLYSQSDCYEPFAICFKHYPIALRCTKIDSVEASHITPLPNIMKNAGSCVQGFIQYETGVVFVVDIDALLQRGEVQCNGTHGA